MKIKNFKIEDEKKFEFARYEKYIVINSNKVIFKISSYNIHNYYKDKISIRLTLPTKFTLFDNEKNFANIVSYETEILNLTFPYYSADRFYITCRKTFNTSFDSYGYIYPNIELSVF